MTMSWKLLDMRSRLQLIDTQLVVLLARRFEVMREVREWKRAEGLPLFDSRREDEVLQRATELGFSLGVPETLIRKLYEQLFEHVRGRQHVPGKRGESGLTQIKDEPAAINQNPPGPSSSVPERFTEKSNSDANSWKR